MMTTLELLVSYWGAFDALINTWNLWQRGALTDKAALEEIGRILKDTVATVGSRAPELTASGPAPAAAPMDRPAPPPERRNPESRGRRAWRDWWKGQRPR